MIPVEPLGQQQALCDLEPDAVDAETVARLRDGSSKVTHITEVMGFDIESSKELRSLARLSRPWAVKKLIALSRAEFTRLPVASRVWVRVMRSEVCCNCSRFDRTPAERTMSDILRTFLV